MTSVIDHARHTPYSDPGLYADLVDDLPVEPESLSALARNVIVHYRASGQELPSDTRDDINARWLEQILAADQSRHPGPLDEARPLTERVQGCCRDHTLFCVGVLRSHRIPARSRVGFAGYFVDGWHHDHVIVEPDTYGVDPDVAVLRGERFLFDEVIHEVAHRFGDELLLWDAWGKMDIPGTPVSSSDAQWLDEIAGLLLEADAGDAAAERVLLQRYGDDRGLHPGPTIIQASPYGDPPIKVGLDR